MVQSLKYAMPRVYISKEVEDNLSCLSKGEFTDEEYEIICNQVTLNNDITIRPVAGTVVVNILPSAEEETIITIRYSEDLETKISLYDKFSILTADVDENYDVLNLNIQTKEIDITAVDGDDNFPLIKGIDIIKDYSGKDLYLAMLKILPANYSFHSVVFAVEKCKKDTINVAINKLLCKFNDCGKGFSNNTVLFNPVRAELLLIDELNDNSISCGELLHINGEPKLIGKTVNYTNITPMYDLDGNLAIADTYHPISPCIYVEQVDDDGEVSYVPYSYTANNIEVNYDDLQLISKEEISDSVLEISNLCDKMNSNISSINNSNAGFDENYKAILDECVELITQINGCFYILSQNNEDGIFIPYGEKFRFINNDVIESYKSVVSRLYNAYYEFIKSSDIVE